MSYRRNSLALALLVSTLVAGGTPALAGCSALTDIASLGLSAALGNCKAFGTAPAKTPPPGGSRDAPGTYIGTTTPGPLKVAPVKVMSNAGDPIRQTGKPTVTRVMSNAGQPIKTTGASGMSFETYGLAREQRAATEKADARQLRKQADREAKNGNDVAAQADRDRAKAQMQSAIADRKIGQNLVKIGQARH